MPYSKLLTTDERATLDDEIADLRAQLETYEDEAKEPERIDHTNMLVGSTIALAVLAVAAIVTIFIVRPDKDNTAMVATLMGFLVPLMTALLAAAVQQVHAAVNSRLTQLLRVTAAKSRAEGRAEGAATAQRHVIGKAGEEALRRDKKPEGAMLMMKEGSDVL